MHLNPDGTEFRDEWGWTSYRGTGWVRSADGRRLYEAHLRTFGSPRGFSTCTLRFYARHPRLALRALCQGKKSLAELEALEGTTLN